MHNACELASILSQYFVSSTELLQWISTDTLVAAVGKSLGNLGVTLQNSQLHYQIW